MRSFFVDPDEIRKPVATIAGTDAHHIRKVLRLRPGARLRVTDGAGQTADACIRTIATDGVQVEILAPGRTPAAGSCELVVAQAMLKDRKMDGLIRALTELGLTIWMPFVSARSVAQPDPRRLQTRQARWERIAREAVKQCGRRRQPKIHVAGGLVDVVGRTAAYARKIMFWEEAATLPSAPRCETFPSGIGGVALIIGPEGGFTVEEAEIARHAGFQLAALGPRVLRAETAALAAVTLAQYIYGDWQAAPASDQDG